MKCSLALGALLLVVGCAKKEIGEPCEDARDGRECEYELCQITQSSPSSRTTCTKHCDDSKDCPDDGRCIGGRCQATCDTQNDCPPETLCREGLCQVECRSDDDCVNASCPAPGQVCEQ